MKRLIDEIRQSIAEWLLFRAALVSPHTDDGDVIVRAAGAAFRELAAKESRQ